MLSFYIVIFIKKWLIYILLHHPWIRRQGLSLHTKVVKEERSIFKNVKEKILELKKEKEDLEKIITERNELIEKLLLF